MTEDANVELKLIEGESWIEKALRDFEFRADCYRQLSNLRTEHGVVAYEKNGTYRVGLSVVQAVVLLQDTLLAGNYKYQVAPVNARELLR